MKRLTVDTSVCAGCRVCEMYCSFAREKKFSPTLSRITVVKEEKHGMDYPVFCRQCDNCTAIEACPTDALYRTNEGIIQPNLDTCISCGQCAQECKYNAVKMFDGTPIICDLCGGDPMCVKKCPTNAIKFIETDVFNEYPQEAFQILKKRWKIND
jgi:Fe-S-cluster-containing hydrogenase component 2